MIECKDLMKIYRDEENKTSIPALRGCDLDVSEGELVSIVGPSGSGKTTLVNILAGIETISSGLVGVAGYQLEKMSVDEIREYRLRIIGLVDQFPERTLFLNGTVHDNLHFSINLKHRCDPTTEDEEIKNILGKLGIEHLISRKVKTLSGGEMTRVAIANALIKKPKLLLCDEPTGQLDSENTESVKLLLNTICEEFSTTILVVTHDYRFLKGSKRTFQIQDGRLSAIISSAQEKKKSDFPLEFRSYIDSSNNMRIPDIIKTSLQLEKEVKIEVNKTNEVKLMHPDNLEARRITIKPTKKMRKTLTQTPLPSDYFKEKKIAIKLEGISKNYYKHPNQIEAISSIDLSIYKGELVFIVGPSGSGKTTLTKILSGLEEASSGIIKILDENFSEMNDDQKARYRRDNIGLVSQQGNLHTYLTVLENLYLKDIFTNFKNYNFKSKTNEDFLKKYNIWHRKDSYPLEISGGELQRAAIALANQNNPQILILDEPTANMDSELADQIIDRLIGIHQSYELTMLIITHDISILTDGSRVIELIDGKISKDGIIYS